LVSAWLGCGCVGASGDAFAQAPPAPAPAPGVDVESSDIDRARALAKAANRALQQTHSYAEALDDASRAEVLYHAPFHLWLIAQALVGLGRLAEAMETLERLVSEPLLPTAPEVFRNAQEQGRQLLKDLSAREPSLLVTVKGPSPGDVNVTIDDKPFALNGSTATWIDPGAHRLHALAPGYAPFEQTLDLPSKGGVVVVEVALEKESSPEAATTR
jgi:hypothetical protein